MPWPTIRVEITRAKYTEMSGLEVSPESIGATHYGERGKIHYVFIDDPDTSQAEVAWLEDLYKL